MQSSHLPFYTNFLLEIEENNDAKTHKGSITEVMQKVMKWGNLVPQSVGHSMIHTLLKDTNWTLEI